MWCSVNKLEVKLWSPKAYNVKTLKIRTGAFEGTVRLRVQIRGV